METGGASGAFIVIGENIHATRVVLRAGRHVVERPDGGAAVRFVGDAGEERLLDVPAAIRASRDFENGRVKHVAAAITAAMSDDPAASDAGIAYLETLARRQVRGGADYLDLNVDELSTEVPARCAAMAWLVRTVAGFEAVRANGRALALDSSSADVIRAGLDAIPAGMARPLLNSASIERLDVLDLAKGVGCPVIAGASGRGAMPSGVDDRVENAAAIVELARGRGLPLSDIHLDALVMPVAVDPEAGTGYLDAVRILRQRFGAELHLTGGMSNVSF
ncbi:MAG TPA: dihydropteroate synthase, partial [Candidatus Limnocylindrales bacterium]